MQALEILEIADKHNGVVLASQVKAAGLEGWALQALVSKGVLTSVQRGVYVTEGGYVDDFFLLQQKFRKGVFSHETALYLHGLSERAPLRYVMTFPKGTSTSRMKTGNVRPVITNVNFELGAVTLERTPSNPIRVYDVERTLVDLLKPKYDADAEQLIPAFKMYARLKNKDVNKLFRYAAIFGVEEKARNYMEVLL